MSFLERVKRYKKKSERPGRAARRPELWGRSRGPDGKGDLSTSCSSSEPEDDRPSRKRKLLRLALSTCMCEVEYFPVSMLEYCN